MKRSSWLKAPGFVDKSAVTEQTLPLSSPPLGTLFPVLDSCSGLVGDFPGTPGIYRSGNHLPKSLPARPDVGTDAKAVSARFTDGGSGPVGGGSFRVFGINPVKSRRPRDISAAEY